MKETKKAILELLKNKGTKKNAKFENLVLNLALQEIDGDSFEYDGEAVYTADGKRLIYCLAQGDSLAIAEGVRVLYDREMSKDMVRKIRERLHTKELDASLAGGRYQNHKDLMSFPDCRHSELTYDR